DDDHLINLLMIEEPVGDIHHHVTHSNDRHPSPNFESLLAKGRKKIIVINDVFGVIYANRVFALDAQFFGALSSCGHDDRTETEILQILQTHRLVSSDGDVAKIEDLGIGENTFELLSQSCFHFFFVDENPILRQSAGFDITVQQDDPVSGFGELPSAIETCRPGAHDSD